MTDAPWFPHYVKDWIMDTRELTHEQKGVHMDLLCIAWDRAGLPTESEALRRHASASSAVWRRSWPAISAKWTERDGVLVNTGLEGHRDKVTGLKQAASESAQRKWQPSRSLAQQNRANRSQRLAAARQKATHTQDEWDAMRAAYGRCLRCQATGVVLVRDHIIPVYQGGSDGIKNIQPLCSRCNASKGPDATDHRIGLPETRVEWLPNACETPAERLRSVSYSHSESESDPQSHNSSLTLAVGARVPPTPGIELSNGQLQAAVSGLIGAWNDRCAVPGSPFQAITARSHPKATQALRSHPDIDWWAALFARVGASDFLRRDAKMAPADLWWVLDHVEEIAAGRYDNREPVANVDPNALAVAAAKLAVRRRMQ